MLRKSLALLALLVLGCDRAVFSAYPPIPDLGITTVEGAMRWVAAEIAYELTVHPLSGKQYLQPPEQTYWTRTGDCADIPVLALYLIHRDVGIDGTMAIGYHQDIPHAWVYVDGHHWEPQTAEMVDDDPVYELVETVGYYEILWRSRVTHRGLTAD